MTSNNMMNTSTSMDENNIEELVRQCSATPQLKLGVEVIQAAESYENEGQYSVALENYERALGILIPLLNTEPKGLRRNLLTPQIKRWMSRAEAVKELLSVQERVLADGIGSDSMDSEKTCVVQ